ncbi:MAG: c-type cytochrome [Pseudomonadales bacterium]
MALLVLGGCGRAADEESDASQAMAPSVSAAQAGTGGPGAAQPDAAVMGKWSRSCALCHVDGNAGAPRVGNAAEWAPRMAQGMDVLLTHTLQGFNDMPPLGYCMSCERADFVAMIEFMGSDSTEVSSKEVDSVGGASREKRTVQ